MLPSELWKEIISRLPAKCLLRSRCVSKSWRRMIDCPDLIKLHLSKSAQSFTNHTLILTETGFNLHLLDLGLIDGNNNAQVSETPFVANDIYGISNTCNGIVVVIAEMFGPLALWNPFLRKRMIFPDSPSKCVEFYQYPSLFYGLCYDSRIDDYKVVRNYEYRSIYTRKVECSKTEIYTFKSKVWREVQPFPCSLPYSSLMWGRQVNGALHILCNDKPFKFKPSTDFKSRIVGFSVESESYFEWMLPLSIPTKGAFMGLDFLGDCLMLACDTVSCVNVWVMKEYGEQDTWNNLITIVYPMPHDLTDLFKPLVYSKDGKKVMFFCNQFQFVWYDLERKIMEKVEVGGVPFLIQLEDCIQSLVFPGGSSEPSEGKKNRQEKKIKQKRDDFLSKGFKLKL
ncbi:hypothetical protein CASFOL_000996 [Castilleja foliolosa]|uniref:F-box domain-containing protein n=1 Tax=Castilleja foliolosa TaxID=1961234 RepID=A0ABD3EQ47_9LAMI